jgi:hypothetical protein
MKYLGDWRAPKHKNVFLVQLEVLCHITPLQNFQYDPLNTKIAFVSGFFEVEFEEGTASYIWIYILLELSSMWW